MENSGLRSAQLVTVYLDSDSISEMNVTLTMPASSITEFEFILPEASQGITRYDVRWEVLGDDANFTTGNSDAEDFGIEYLVQGSEKHQPDCYNHYHWIDLFIILYFGFKASERARRSGSRF